jgi:hypothetical protein
LKIARTAFFNILLERCGVGKKILGDASLAVLFGVNISGAAAKTGKAVFLLHFYGKLRDAGHDSYKKITGV